MKSLASGTNCESIYKLLKVTIDTHQNLFAEAFMNSEAIEDIADKVTTRKSLYIEEKKNANDDIQESPKQQKEEYWLHENLNNGKAVPEFVVD